MTDPTPKWANVSFNQGIYSVDSGTSFTMHMPCKAFMDYFHRPHFQFVLEFLCPGATIPEPPTPTHNAHTLGVSKHGHLSALQVQHYPEEKSLME